MELECLDCKQLFIDNHECIPIKRNTFYSVSLIAKYLGYNKYVNAKDEILRLITPDPEYDLNVIQNKISELSIQNKDIIIPTNIENLNQTEIISEILKIETNLIQSALNCSYGSYNECNVINLIKEKYGYDVVENNSKCYSMVIEDIKICGRIDGFIYINGEKYLVEIKSRKNRLFKYMPIYEKVQILLYTKLCGCNKVIYIQNHGSNLSLEIFNNFEDKKLYDEIIKRLQLVDRCVKGEDINTLCYWIK